MTEDGTESDGDIKPEPKSHVHKSKGSRSPTYAKDLGCGIIFLSLLLIIGPLLIYLPFHIGWFEYAMEYQGSPRTAARGFTTGIAVVLVGVIMCFVGIVLLPVVIIDLVEHFRTKEKDDNDDGRES